MTIKGVIGIGAHLKIKTATIENKISQNSVLKMNLKKGFMNFML
jgi:hypothetical protein